MTIGEVKSTLYKNLGGKISDYGFKLVKSKDQYENHTAWGKKVIGVPILNYNPDYWITFLCSVRIDAVEDVFNLCAEVLPAFQKETLTLVTPYGYFEQQKDYYFKVSEEAQILNVIEKFVEFFNGKGLDFFNQYSNLEKVEEAINSFDFTNSLVRMNLPSRAMHGLILAKMCNKINYQSILKRYIVEMERFNQMDKNRFNKMIEYLESANI